MRLLVVGDSHIVSIQRADVIRQCAPASAVPILTFLQLGDPDLRFPIRSEAWQRAIRRKVESAVADEIVSLIGGNAHNIFGLVNHPVKFDFILPSQPDLDVQPDAQLIPLELVRKTLTKRLQPTIDVLDRLIELGFRPRWHLESPPPVPSGDHIRNHPGVFAEQIAKLGIAPAALRYKLWRLHSSIFSEECAARQIEFVGAPATMQDKNGMLVESAWNPDPTHGNGLYGEQLIQQLTERMADLSAPSLQ